MTQEKQTAFKLDRVLILESSIKRNPKNMGDFAMDIDPSGLIDHVSNTYTLKLDVVVNDSNDSFTAKVSAIGIFYFKTEDKLSLCNYFYTNAPAIMFPYIRAYISSLTALSGLPAVNLPVEKFAFTDKLKAQTHYTSDSIGSEEKD